MSDKFRFRLWTLLSVFNLFNAFYALEKPVNAIPWIASGIFIYLAYTEYRRVYSKHINMELDWKSNSLFSPTTPGMYLLKDKNRGIVTDFWNGEEWLETQDSKDILAWSELNEWL